MTTVVNNPGSGATTDNTVGTVFALLIIALIALLFFIYGLPAIRDAANTGLGTPSRIDVNIPNNEPPVNNNIIIPQATDIPEETEAPTSTPVTILLPEGTASPAL